MSSVSTFGVQSRQLKPSERWICFAALFFLGFTATFNQFKAAPAIQYIGADMTGPWIACILMGIAGALVPTGTRAIAPVLVPEPKKTDLVLATMAFATGVAQVVGGYIVSSIVTSIGYQANAQFVLTPLALLAAVLVIVFVKSDRKTHEVRVVERAAQDAAEAEAHA